MEGFNEAEVVKLFHEVFGNCEGFAVKVDQSVIDSLQQCQEQPKDQKQLTLHHAINGAINPSMSTKQLQLMLELVHNRYLQVEDDIKQYREAISNYQSSIAILNNDMDEAIQNHSRINATKLVLTLTDSITQFESYIRQIDYDMRCSLEVLDKLSKREKMIMDMFITKKRNGISRREEFNIYPDDHSNRMFMLHQKGVTLGDGVIHCRKI